MVEYKPLKKITNIQTGDSETLKAVLADLRRQEAKGRSKYGGDVDKAHLSLKEWLQHAYEETLDQAVYLKKAIEKLNENSSND